ncbi:MAG: cellulase family glycosylhydrolase [Chloroflexi bacterium]|nr:cellulase family glycosylhydrolase [Chloroflexota bacterium]
MKTSHQQVSRRQGLMWVAAAMGGVLGAALSACDARRPAAEPKTPATPTAPTSTPKPAAPTPQPTAAPTTVPPTATPQPGLSEPSFRKLPLWYGFNLQEKFNNDWGARRFQERDFEWIAELGFNFVRLPMDYRTWAEPNNWSVLRQGVLEEIDQVLRWAERYELHVNINFHRAPGYSVTPPAEPKSLWDNDEAQFVCATHWANFARRYKGVPNKQLSFNLINEPPAIDPALHRAIISRLCDAIRKYDDKRLIVCDGASWGKTPPGELVGLNVAAATRGYEPLRLTHYQAEWINGADRWAPPTHPLRDGATVWDRETVWRAQIEPWTSIQTRGIGVMVGEFGVYNRTRHDVALAFMRERLQLWREAGWGWALWNFRGPFGIIDSGRADVAYERWRGAQLDRKMLDVLRSFLPGAKNASP